MNRDKLVATARASRGAINDLIDSAYEHYKEHGRESWIDAFREAAADKVLQRYDEKIRNGFERAGLTLPEGELTQANMLSLVGEQTGLELSNLDPDAVMKAVDKLLSERLGAHLGVPITSVFDKQALLQSVNAAVVQAIQSGRAQAWISAKSYTAARRYATYKRRNIDKPTAEVLDARARQKKYRRTHVLKWD